MQRSRYSIGYEIILNLRETITTKSGILLKALFLPLLHGKYSLGSQL